MILKFSRLLLLWFVYEACWTFTGAQVVVKWLHLFWISRQPAVSHHKTGWWVVPKYSCFMWYVESKMAPVNIIWPFPDWRSLCPPFCCSPDPPPLQECLWHWLYHWKSYRKWWAMDLIHYSFAPLILFCVLYTLDLLLYYLSIANGTGSVGIFELLVFQCFVYKLLS